MAALPPLPDGFQVVQAPPASTDAVPALPPGFQVEGAPQGQPGSADYAAWAVQQAKAGNALPQVSPTPPEWQPQDVLPAWARSFSTHAVESVPVLGPIAANSRADDPYWQATNQSADRQAPAAALSGDAFGTVAPFVAGGTFIPGAAKVLGMEGPLAMRIGAGAASSGTIGGLDAVARGESPTDAAMQGGVDAALGGALPLVGAGVGKMLGIGAAKAIPLADLQAAKDAAYKAADNLGVHYSSQGVDSLVNDMTTKATADNISQMRHPQAWSMLQELQNRPSGATASLTQLDQMRQVIRRDLVDPATTNSAGAAEAHFGRQMIDSIDNFVHNAGPADVVNGSAADGAAAIAKARAANSTFRKSEMIQDALSRADLRAASTGSGGNIDNAVRQNLRGILDSPAKSRGLTAVERAMMERVVRGGLVNNTLRTVGKLSPLSGGLMAALGVGSSFIPGGAAIPASGAIAKILADRSTIGGARAVQALVSNGGHAMPANPVAGAMLRRLGGPAALTLMENRSASGPDPIAQAMLAAAGQ